MKFSSLFLFITLLIILIVIVLFSKYYGTSLEGLVNYNNGENTDYKTIIIKKYSQTKSILKLYDNIYYDFINANMVELDVSNSITNEEDRIQQVYVTTRNNTTSTYSSIPTPDSGEEKSKVSNTLTFISNSKDPFEFKTRCVNTNSYQVVYMPMGIYTSVLIIDLTAKVLNRAFLHYSLDSISPNFIGTNISRYFAVPTGNDDPNNSKDVVVTKYDGTKKIHQLSKTVWIDKTNGYYIIDQGELGQNIYAGGYPASGAISSTFTKRIDKFSIYPDKLGYLVVYVGMQNFIGLYILGYSATEQKFKIDKHLIIDTNVPVATATPSETPATTGAGASVPPGTAPPPTDNLGPYSDYYRWLAYWNATGKTGIFSQDYIEKTQIVPPVCPACPTCPSTGVCTNCGGNGGSGSSNVNTNNQQSQQPGVIRGVADTAGRTVTGVVDTTADVLKSTGSGASDLLKSTGSGATDLLKSTGSGASDLLKSAGSGATDLLKSAGSGTYNFITGKWLDSDGNEQPANGRTPPTSISGAQAPYGGPQQYRDGGGQGAGRMMGPDRYNYNGALTDKGGNFIPVTADFSAFGR